MTPRWDWPGVAMMRFYVKPPFKPIIACAHDDLPPKDSEVYCRQTSDVPRNPTLLGIECGTDTWDSSQSAELQVVVDALNFDQMHGMEFSVTLANPSMPDCPLVACSLAFSRLTRYNLEEIIGKNCRFLKQGVPDELICEETRCKARAFCLAAAGGFEQQEPGEVIETLRLDKPCVKMGDGEVLCVQTNAKKTGELFRNMFFLKTIDLDDRPFIIGLQAELGEEYVDGGPESERLRKVCSEAFTNLNRNMDALERVLASQFRYTGAMRRFA